MKLRFLRKLFPRRRPPPRSGWVRSLSRAERQVLAQNLREILESKRVLEEQARVR